MQIVYINIVKRYQNQTPHVHCRRTRLKSASPNVAATCCSWTWPCRRKINTLLNFLTCLLPALFTCSLFYPCLAPLSVLPTTLFFVPHRLSSLSFLLLLLLSLSSFFFSFPSYFPYILFLLLLILLQFLVNFTVLLFKSSTNTSIFFFLFISLILILFFYCPHPHKKLKKKFLHRSFERYAAHSQLPHIHNRENGNERHFAY